MSTISIEFPTPKRSFAPGEIIEGVVSWSFDKPPKAVDVRLVHYTTGKGTRDLRVADVVSFEDPAEADSRIFSFVAPRGPCSFDGRLVSLTWAIAAMADMKGLFADQCEHIDVVLTQTPDGRPIELYQA